MVIVGTKILSGDNSGARLIKVFKVIGSHKRKAAVIGDKIVGSIKLCSKKKKIKKHDVCTALLIRQKKKYKRYTGLYISFSYNYAVLIDKKRGGPLGTRIFGPFMYELRRKKFIKFLSIATTII